MIKWGRKNCCNESIIDILCVVSEPESGKVEKCSINNLELIINKIYIVSKSDNTLPLTLDDASRPITMNYDDGDGDDDKDAGIRPRVTRDTRLDSRIVDLRAAPHGSLMRLQSAICELFREYLYSENFIEIHSPKLIAGASLGGLDV